MEFKNNHCIPPREVSKIGHDGSEVEIRRLSVNSSSGK
jgi:hypothetical protein